MHGIDTEVVGQDAVAISSLNLIGQKNGFPEKSRFFPLQRRHCPIRLSPECLIWRISARFIAIPSVFPHPART
jgi:hypothetical protein